jgi:hypothetical protein
MWRWVLVNETQLATRSQQLVPQLGVETLNVALLGRGTGKPSRLT